MLLRKYVEKQTGIKVQHVDETADFTGHLEEFIQMTEEDEEECQKIEEKD
jgi:inhibitor of KinA sporulation pathway (predicted exonuclease)